MQTKVYTIFCPTCSFFNYYRLILIAEKHTVYAKFPIPLINRLEKHLVVTQNMLFSWQEEVLDMLIEWVHDFNLTNSGRSDFICI